MTVYKSMFPVYTKCMKRYTDTQILDAVKTSKSFFDLQKNLTGTSSGSSYMHLKKRVLTLGADTSHFDRNWSNAQNSSISHAKSKLDSKVILVNNPTLATRRKTKHLKRAMLEVGVEDKCSLCGLTSWNGASITLQVDHIDGDWKNNEIGNLRFLCPNCHSQTETFGYKGSASKVR